MKLLVLAVVTGAACGGSPSEPALAGEYLEIVVVYPGASPAVIETAVTGPLEDAVSAAAGVAHVFSSSTAGNATIRIEPARGHDVDAVAAALHERLTATLRRLPVEASPPTLRRISRMARHGRLVLADPGRYDQLRDEIQRFAGVGEVRACGVREPRIEVVGDLPRLDAMNVAPSELIAAVGDADVTSPDALSAVAVGAVRVSDVANVARVDARTCDVFTGSGASVVVTVTLARDHAAVWERVLDRARALGIEVTPLNAATIVHASALIVGDDHGARASAVSGQIAQLSAVAGVQWAVAELDPETRRMRLAVGMARDANPSGVAEALDLYLARRGLVMDLDLTGAGFESVDAVITGPDLEALNETALDAMVALGQDPQRRALGGMAVVPVSDHELAIEIDRGRAADLGAELAEINTTLGAALRGIDASSLGLLRDPRPTTPRIVVRVPVDADRLGDLTVRSRRVGRLVALHEVTTFKKIFAPTAILHEDRQRVVILRALVHDRATAERLLRKQLPHATIRAHLAPP